MEAVRERADDHGRDEAAPTEAEEGMMAEDGAWECDACGRRWRVDGEYVAPPSIELVNHPHWTRQICMECMWRALSGGPIRRFLRRLWRGLR